MLNLLEWAERFISTPSVSADGTTEIAAKACELLAEIGLDARREPTQVDGVLHETVIADLGPRGADGLLWEDDESAAKKAFSELRHRGYAVGRSPPRVSPREGGNFRPRWALLTAAPRSKVACSSPDESLTRRPAST